MAMEKGPFIGDFPIETCIHREFSPPMFDYQMVSVSAKSKSPSNKESNELSDPVSAQKRVQF